jgi:hypothetical protein
MGGPVKDHRPGLIADIEDGNTRTFVTVEPGLNGKPRLSIEGWDFLRQETVYRTTIAADAALALAAGIQNQLGDNQ